MSEAKAIHMLTEELQKLICANITPEGDCLFDPVRVKMVLEFAKLEIQKSLLTENTETD